jgi:5-oxoprolinase (ATP-hydrolysing) subunit C
MPLGGAADRVSMAVGNAMLGNPADAAGLEITLVGPSLVATRRVGAVVAGTPFQLSSSRQVLGGHKTFTLEPGEELHIGGTPRGARAYLCVVGGFQTPAILDSRSALAPAASGDELPCAESTAASHFIRPDFLAEVMPTQHPLRIVAGPQADWFPFTLDSAGPWTVSPASNRMGLRLTGPTLTVPPRELISEPVCPGAIQVTQDGQLIILGVDGQTIGGYPKVAQVIGADLDRLGQLRQGDQVSFETVPLQRAEELFRARAESLRLLCARIRLAAEAF